MVDSYILYKLTVTSPNSPVAFHRSVMESSGVGGTGAPGAGAHKIFQESVILARIGRILFNSLQSSGARSFRNTFN